VKIQNHSIASEGEAIAKMYIGNWSDYETMMMEKFGKDLTASCEVSDIEKVSAGATHSSLA
jgi:hypothetical protein